MKRRRRKAYEAIHAAGGIVIRHSREPTIAVVQLRKSESWVLPKGKLNRNETPLAAARREVLEEVGHRVYIHEFLGTIAYEVGARPKVVQFWRMQAVGEPVGKLMDDVKAVAWLPLGEAVERLTHSREQVFLRNVGPIAIEAAARSARKAKPGEPAAAIDVVGRAAAEFNLSVTQESEDQSSDEIAASPKTLEPIQPEQKVAQTAAEPPCEDGTTSFGSAGRDGVIERLRMWFRRMSLAGMQLGRRD
jgi:8-oxo-dGTP diphosphatase